MLNIMLAIGLGTLFGNIAFGYIGDIFGRKKVIIIAHFFEIIGCIIIIFTAFAAESKGNKTSEEFKPFNNTKMFNFDYTKDDYYHIQNYIRYFNLQYFESSNINYIYEENYNKFVKEILISKFIKLFNLIIYLLF